MQELNLKQKKILKGFIAGAKVNIKNNNIIYNKLLKENEFLNQYFKNINVNTLKKYFFIYVKEFDLINYYNLNEFLRGD